MLLVYLLLKYPLFCVFKCACNFTTHVNIRRTFNWTNNNTHPGDSKGTLSNDNDNPKRSHHEWKSKPKCFLSDKKNVRVRIADIVRRRAFVFITESGGFKNRFICAVQKADQRFLLVNLRNLLGKMGDIARG